MATPASAVTPTPQQVKYIEIEGKKILPFKEFDVQPGGILINTTPIRGDQSPHKLTQTLEFKLDGKNEVTWNSPEQMFHAQKLIEIRKYIDKKYSDKNDADYKAMVGALDEGLKYIRDAEGKGGTTNNKYFEPKSDMDVVLNLLKKQNGCFSKVGIDTDSKANFHSSIYPDQLTNQPRNGKAGCVNNDECMKKVLTISLLHLNFFLFPNPSNSHKPN